MAACAASFAVALLNAACGSGAPPRLPLPSTTPWSAVVGESTAPSDPTGLSDRRLGRTGLACLDCHRAPGASEPLRPAPPLGGLGARGSFWSGLAPSAAVAVNLCVERWLSRPALEGAALAALVAAADGPAPPAGEASPPPSTAAKADLADLPEGDAGRGRALYDAACRHCHEDGPGGALWGRAWSRGALARTVRGLDRPRHPGTLMPTFDAASLPDASLADLTTALADAVQPGM